MQDLTAAHGDPISALPELFLALAGLGGLVIAILVFTYVWSGDPAKRRRSREMIVLLLAWLLRLRRERETIAPREGRAARHARTHARAKARGIDRPSSRSSAESGAGERTAGSARLAATTGRKGSCRDQAGW
jgi:hypothetical protein